MPRAPLIRILIQPVLIAVLLASVVRSAVGIYSIPSASMAPGLVPGDQIVVTRYLRRGPQRGDVVVFRSPRDHDEVLVKRVIGVPGDVLDSRLGRIRIDGITRPEPYLLRQAASGAIPPKRISDGHYVLLGDNRDDSVDSRTWGELPESMILGRVEMVLWSSSSRAVEDAHATTSAARRPGTVTREVRLFKRVR